MNKAVFIDILCVAALMVCSGVLGFNVAVVWESYNSDEAVRNSWGMTASTESVIIEDSVWSKLNNLYEVSLSEYVLCLKGVKEGGVLRVNDYEFVTLFNSSMSSVRHKSCHGNGVLGSLHNHINHVCRPSVADVYWFGDSSNAYMFVQCGVGEVFYLNHDLEEGMIYG